MEWLALTDVEQVVHLVSWAADPTVEIPIPERKRLLLEGVAKLVSADIWVWHTTVFSSSVPGDAMATNLINGGWISEQEPAKFMEALLNPELRPAIGRLYDFCRDHHLTLLRESLPYAEDLQAIDTAWASIGIGHFLLSVYPLGENASSAVGFYRRLGKPAFTGRDRAVAHVVISQVDWLHRHGVDVRAKEKILMLSTRERQVTAFLLGGDSIKEVARKLEISEHTVGDYVKQIYKHFDVNSRAELLSHFIAGGQRYGGHVSMHWLALTDVEQIVRLVSEAADPTVEISIPERKRILLEGVAKLVSADIWYWSTTVFNPTLKGDNMVTSMIHGGWISEQESTKFFGALLNPEHRPTIGRLYDFCRDHHVTLSRECFPLKDERSAFIAALHQAGVGNFLVSFYPLGENSSSGIGFYRRPDTPDFTDRDRVVVHVVISQVDWLHRHGVDVPAKHKVLRLSARERQVMALLLGGDTIKEVARKLELSDHTVGDYVKEIYKHFAVNSRAELLAHFIAGGQR